MSTWILIDPIGRAVARLAPLGTGRQTNGCLLKEGSRRSALT